MEEDLDIIEYYEGKKGEEMKKADKLLFITARNNFIMGYNKALEEYEEKILFYDLTRNNPKNLIEILKELKNKLKKGKEE